MNLHAKDKELVLKRVKEVIERNKKSDIFNKTFLRPIQIALKTRKTEKDENRHKDALPYGLKQVLKKDIQGNQYDLCDFQSFKTFSSNRVTVENLQNNNLDNLISLMKPVDEDDKIELCICICMYSEDKNMLRKTLAGVAQNILTFERNGIKSDQIAVVVVMDGIEKVDPTVVDFFSELEKESNIYLEDNIEEVDADEIVRDTFNTSQVDEEEVININTFLFDECELEDRRKRQFEVRKKQYEEAKRMIGRIDTLIKNKKVHYDDLDQFILPFFQEKAKEAWRKESYENSTKILVPEDEARITQEYANNIKKSRSIINEALYEARTHCLKYIDTREDFALLNSFRMEIEDSSFTKKKKKKEYASLTEENYAKEPVKMNLFLITKYKNSGKLSSHNWFFNGFCKEVKCNFAVLLDVGLVPDSMALFRMYRHMKGSEECGGVCGYMNLRIERLEDEDQEHIQELDCVTRACLKVTDIQRAQQVEYHFAHLIDKPFESIFKFIHVLPGAFSAYRMKALQPSEEEDSELMRNYFKALEESAQEVEKVEFSGCQVVLKILLPDALYNCCFNKSDKMTEETLLYDSNVYLAEDRTLCMGIHQNGYNLEYLPDAHAWVDPIKNLHGLLGQRKRWINGSFFAFEKVKQTLGKSKSCDLCLKLQIFYLNFMNMLSFIAPALFLFTIHIAMFAFRDFFFYQILSTVSYGNSFPDTEFYNGFIYVIDFIYIMLFLGLIFYSMHFTHRNKKFVPYIYTVSTVMGLFAIVVFVVLFIDMITGLIDSVDCMQKGRVDCELTFLSDNPVLRERFFESLPGGIISFTIYKWLVVGIIALYIVPISIYAIFYCRCSFLIDVLAGTLSFLFYTPTYMNILSTFALCRIDDISWGTKGLDAEDNKNQSLKETWKTIKILYVAKFIFWNTIVSIALLIVSNPLFLNGEDGQYDQNSTLYQNRLLQSYVRKFFMVFGLMAIIGITLFFKIFLGAIYSMCFRCCSTHHVKHPKKTAHTVDECFQKVEDSLMENVEKSVFKIVDNEIEQIDKMSKKDRNNLLGAGLTSYILKGNLKSTVALQKDARTKWNQSHIQRKVNGSVKKNKIFQKANNEKGKKGKTYEGESNDHINRINHIM